MDFQPSLLFIVMCELFLSTVALVHKPQWSAFRSRKFKVTSGTLNNFYIFQSSIDEPFDALCNEPYYVYLNTSMRFDSVTNFQLPSFVSHCEKAYSFEDDMECNHWLCKMGFGMFGLEGKKAFNSTRDPESGLLLPCGSIQKSSTGILHKFSEFPKSPIH